MKRNFLLALAVVVCGLLASCSGSMNQHLMPSNGVPMSLTIGDTPPNGVGVLFFEAMITGVSLQPADATKPAVSALTTPTEVEFGHLQTDTAFLGLANVAPDTYQSMTVTFGSATMTIVNHSGSAMGGCADNSVCELTPSFNLDRSDPAGGGRKGAGRRTRRQGRQVRRRTGRVGRDQPRRRGTRAGWRQEL